MTAAGRFARARPRLLRLAYSELGDLGEAEDAVQEAWLRLERSDAEQVENLDGWLTTVVARIALDRLRSARARRETYIGPWLPEPLTSEDPADRVTLDESVSYALLTVLEQLSPAERTAFVLHDVFDVPFADIAEVVGRTTRPCERSPKRSPRATSRASSPYSTQTSSGPQTAAGARSPPASRCKAGHGVARAWTALRSKSVHEPIEINLNGRLGLVLASSDGHRAALSFLVNYRRITRIDAIRNPEKLRRL
jgi:RNA polymerase sigma-70 factor, ECF subfamily